MRGLIVNSPLYEEKQYINEMYLPPIGLAYIATQLDKENIEVELIDCVYERLGVKEIISLIEKKDIDYIGINIFTVNKNIVKDIIKKVNKNIIWIIGGKVTKSIYKEIANLDSNGQINIVIGDGDLITTAIVKKNVLEKCIYEYGNNKVYNIDKNSKYFLRDISNNKLNRKFLENRAIVNKYNKNEEAIITSRGCIYNCAFCGGAKSLNENDLVRENKKDEIVKEIKDIIQINNKVQSIRVLDDLFLKNRSNILRAIDIFSEFEKLSWRSMAHILSFSKSFDIIKNLKKSGCDELFIGIESGSMRIRNSIRKLGDRKEILQVIYRLLYNDINVKGYFIYGFPDENFNDIIQTYTLANTLKLISKSLPGTFTCSVFQYRPYEGTELYNTIKLKQKKKNFEFLRKDHESRRSQFSFIAGNFSNCTQEEIDTYIRKTLNLNYGEINDKKNKRM